jgi:hypothetical protein
MPIPAIRTDIPRQDHAFDTGESVYDGLGSILELRAIDHHQAGRVSMGL